MSIKTALFSVLIFACGYAFAEQTGADQANPPRQQSENASREADAKPTAGGTEKPAEKDEMAARRAREESQSQNANSVQDLFQGDHN